MIFFDPKPKFDIEKRKDEGYKKLCEMKTVQKNGKKVGVVKDEKRVINRADLNL